MRAIRVEVIGPEKHVRPYNKCVRPYLEERATAKFVLFKMSHESEHSQSEFYYPLELSHAELLHQSPTHSLRKQRRKFNTPRE